MAIFSSSASAHGAVGMVDHKCVLRIGPDIISFSSRQPDDYPQVELCDELPESGKTIVTLDMQDEELRDMLIEVRIIEDDGKLYKYNCLPFLTDAELGSNAFFDLMTTIVYIPSKTYPTGILTYEYNFTKAGKFIGIVTVKNGHGQAYVSQFPFTVGQQRSIADADRLREENLRLQAELAKQQTLVTEIQAQKSAELKAKAAEAEAIKKVIAAEVERQEKIKASAAQSAIAQQQTEAAAKAETEKTQQETLPHTEEELAVHAATEDILSCSNSKVIKQLSEMYNKNKMRIQSNYGGANIAMMFTVNLMHGSPPTFKAIRTVSTDYPVRGITCKVRIEYNNPVITNKDLGVDTTCKHSKEECDKEEASKRQFSESLGFEYSDDILHIDPIDLNYSAQVTDDGKQVVVRICDPVGCD